MSAARSSMERSLVDWRRVGYGICPTKPRNAASLGQPAMRNSRYRCSMRHLRDRARRPADGLGAQRRSAVHGDGRDGGGGADRGRRRPCHSHGSRAAGGAGAEGGDRGRARRARRRRGSTTPPRSAFPRCASASPGTIATAYGCAVDAERIVVTTGSSGAFILAFLAMFEPGDRVAVTVPGYPPYRHILTALGCEPVLIETSSETRHALTGEALLAAHRKTPLKGVLVGSPANPTGTMMSREALTSLIAAAEGAGIRFISDEIYHGLDYAFPAVTAAELSPHALVINSFSKYFCMTGWRVGWMVVPEPLVRPIERLQQNLAISVPTLSQIAAEAAFEGREEMEAIKRGYQENRRILIEGLPQAGLDQIPAGRRRVLSLCRRLRSSPPTVSSSPARCWKRRMSRRRRASISIRSTATASSAFPMRARPTTCARRLRASRAGSDRARRHRRRSRIVRHRALDPIANTPTGAIDSAGAN